VGLGLSDLVTPMKIAFVFPGQGSQSVGMMAGFDAHPAIRATFDEASQVLGQDLWALVTSGPEADLDQTVNTQPAMLTAGVAVWRAWQAAGGPAPSIVAGHSLGEYTALVAAGALAFRDAVPLVRYRALVMQEAVPSGIGAMAAILGLDAATVGAICIEASGDPAAGKVVEPVNFNGPEQIVIAGRKDAVERAVAMATERGAKRGLLLPVSAPFHSSLMKPAALRLAEKLASVSIQAPAIPVLHNVDVAERNTAEAIRAALARQAASPVRWVETIQAFAARGVTHVVECGPGRVLAGLNKRIARDLKSFALTDGTDIDAAKAALAN
jgi:[acyl-carrier-protein] S-malonyltransferase